MSGLPTAFAHAARTAARRDLGISRTTAHECPARFDAQPPLAGRSRRPRPHPRRHPPAARPRRLGSTRAPTGRPAVRALAPRPAPAGRRQGSAEVARREVYPLSALDDHSRFLPALGCGTGATTARAWDVPWGPPGEDGPPGPVLRDNAFGPRARGKVGRPHGTPEAEAVPRLPRDDLSPFAAGLDRRRREVYNAARPPEAPGDRPPVCRWRPSRRPETLPVVGYPPGGVARRVSAAGDVRWRCAKSPAGRGPVGERVRVEGADGSVGRWYGPYRTRRIPPDRLEQPGLL